MQVSAVPDWPARQSLPLRLPALPALTSLDLSLLTPDTSILVCLAYLPSLAELDIGGSGTAAVAGVQSEAASAKEQRESRPPAPRSSGGSSGSKLVRAKLGLVSLEVNFALMPALAHLELSDSLRFLNGAAGIAAATALTQLQLDAHFTIPEEGGLAPWRRELMLCLPSSLRALSLPRWRAGLASMLVALPRLVGLSVREWEPQPPPTVLPAATALWASLRALDISTAEVPQVGTACGLPAQTCEPIRVLEMEARECLV